MVPPAKVALGLAVAVVSLTNCGCGTIDNLSAPGKYDERALAEPRQLVYGGVRKDWSTLAQCRIDTEFAIESAIGNAIWIPLLTFDLLLSAGGDTITLPYILVCQVRQSINSSQQDSSSQYPSGGSSH